MDLGWISMINDAGATVRLPLNSITTIAYDDADDDL